MHPAGARERQPVRLQTYTEKWTQNEPSPSERQLTGRFKEAMTNDHVSRWIVTGS